MKYLISFMLLFSLAQSSDTLEAEHIDDNSSKAINNSSLSSTIEQLNVDKTVSKNMVPASRYRTFKSSRTDIKFKEARLVNYQDIVIYSEPSAYSSKVDLNNTNFSYVILDVMYVRGYEYPWYKTELGWMSIPYLYKDFIKKIPPKKLDAIPYFQVVTGYSHISATTSEDIDFATTPDKSGYTLIAELGVKNKNTKYSWMYKFISFNEFTITSYLIGLDYVVYNANLLNVTCGFLTGMESMNLTKSLIGTTTDVEDNVLAFGFRANAEYKLSNQFSFVYQYMIVKAKHITVTDTDVTTNTDTTVDVVRDFNQNLSMGLMYTF